VEAAHIGRRGLSQKSSDKEAIPLCYLHHREQHRIGLKRFQKTYELDIPSLIDMLQEKPRIAIGRTARTAGYYVALYRSELFTLLPVHLGLGESVALALQLCREYLIESHFHAARECSSHRW
jgi:hypothetical protein